MSDDPAPDSHPNSSRRSLFATIAAYSAAAAGGLGALTAARPAAAQSVAWKQAGNNHHVLELQQAAATAGSGAVTLDYFGHCAFRITSPAGLTLVFDPWRNDPSGAWGLWFPKEFPKLVADIGLSTHTHFDHDAIDRIEATTILDRMVGTWSFADVTITGIADKHAILAPGWFKWINVVREFGGDPNPPNNPGHLDMVSYVVETGGIRILIWGDNRHNPPDDVWQRWGRIDVLTLPVDGSMHILSFEQGDSIVARLQPRIVIPTHYLMPGISSTLSTLQPAEGWVAGQKNHRMLDSPSLTLRSSELAPLAQEFFYFGEHAMKA